VHPITKYESFTLFSLLKEPLRDLARSSVVRPPVVRRLEVRRAWASPVFLGKPVAKRTTSSCLFLLARGALSVLNFFGAVELSECGIQHHTSNIEPSYQRYTEISVLSGRNDCCNDFGVVIATVERNGVGDLKFWITLPKRFDQLSNLHKDLRDLDDLALWVKWLCVRGFTETFVARPSMFATVCASAKRMR
jgi:hypothetical protein